MSNSLQDQLLKLGLVDEKKLKKAKHEKHAQAKQQPKKKPVVDENRLRAEQAQAKKAERDRELNRQRQEGAQRKALVAQIKQIIDENRLPKGDGELAYNFVDGRKVKRLYVTDAVQKKLVRGEVVVVKLSGRYDIVPKDIAEKIRERDAACIVTQDEAEQTGSEDDAYADYKVPDDLMW